MRRSEMDARLAELYARIPAIPDCDGRCWTSCGPIDMSHRERQRIRGAGIRITDWREAKESEETFWCEALTDGKRCAVYEMRPMVCRLWGAVEGMRCPFGCIPEGGFLPDSDGAILVAESLRIGGSDMSLPPPAETERALTSPGYAKVSAAYHAVGRAGMQLRVDEQVPPAFRKAPR